MVDYPEDFVPKGPILDIADPRLNGIFITRHLVSDTVRQSDPVYAQALTRASGDAEKAAEIYQVLMSTINAMALIDKTNPDVDKASGVINQLAEELGVLLEEIDVSNLRLG